MGGAGGLGRQPADAADATQDVLMSVARDLARFDPDGPGATFRGWLWTITRRRLADQARRVARQLEQPDGSLSKLAAEVLPDLADPPTDAADDRAAVASRAAAMLRDQFEPTTWNAFWATVVEKRQPAEVAESLGVTRWAVYKARARVLQRLLEHLDDCRACQQRAEQAETSDDSLVAALGSPMEPDPHAAESDCVAALHLCSRPHENSAQTSTPPVEQLGAYRLILDLGLVLCDHDPLPADDRLTTVGQLMGTLAYMAPEQLTDSTAIDHRADLYALGATLFRLLTGTPPHGSARGIAPLVIAKTRGPVPDLGQARAEQACSEVPPALIDLVQGLLDRDRERRPQSATEVAGALRPHTQGSDLKRLITEARRKRPTIEESRSIAPVPLPMIDPSIPPRHRNWHRIVAAASLPLLLLAGIMLVIVTDRGQLVIESEMAGLNVSVQQGEEVVEQLQLSTGENRITLRSGTYTVAIDAASDGLSLSDDTATVTRGGESVLRVHRKPLPSMTQVDHSNAGPRYRGETFANWLAVLETERDVETVIDAMKAVVALSSDDGFGDDDELIDRGGRATDAESKRAAVAASMLRAARRFGGLRSSGPGIMNSNIHSPSEQFMGHLLAFYPATLPNPGLAAISQELEIGNEKSRMASIWILSSYVGGSFDGPHQPEFGELDRWSRTVEGREELRELSDHIDQAVEALGGYASPALQDVHRGQSGMSSHERELSQAELAYQPRLKINELLEVDSWRDPAISGRLQRSVESARQSTQAWFESVELHGGVEGDPTGPRWLSKPEVAAALNALDAAEGTLDADAAAWAVVPSLLTSYHDHEEPDAARLVLQQLAEVAPVATADAILSLMIARGFYLASTSGGFSGMMSMGAGMGSMGGGMGGGGAGISIHFGNEKLWSLAMEIVGRSTTQPPVALGLLQEKHGQFQGFQKQELAKSPDLEASMVAAITRLEARVNPSP